MTEEEKRAAYLQYINNYTNQNYTEEDLPPLVNLAIEKMLETDKMNVNLKQYREGGISETYHDKIPPRIKMILAPYRKMKW